MTTITIVGGGVAGLALAATLDTGKHHVTLLERHPEIRGVPTAFGIWRFALDALDEIGLAQPLRDAGHLLNSGLITADSTRRPVSMMRRDADTWIITRTALLELLEEAVPDAVRRGQLRVEDPTSLEGDLVVAADGARSVVRRRIWGDQPRDTSTVAIRGVISTPPDIATDEMREYWGDGMLFGVGPNRLQTGLGTNWYASTRRAEESPAEALAWARAAYARFPDVVRDTLAAATPENTVVNSILESRRPRSLVRGRYVLIGDAAHAMSPNLGRGACEAIADAVALGRQLNEHGLDGLSGYERERRRAGQRTRAAAALARRVALSRRGARTLVRLAPG